jgi:predicted nucleotidyltransferase
MMLLNKQKSLPTFLSGKAAVGELLNRRRSETDKRIEQMQKELQDAEKLATDKACVYMTGSFGRGEASQHSDLDVFIGGKNKNKEKDGQPLLTRLDEILLKAELIKATRKLRITDFSGDGRIFTALFCASARENTWNT